MKKSSLFYNNDQRGFTLIELLVVIIIVGILATVALVYINPVEYINRSNDSKRMSELKTINDALLRDIADNKITIGNLTSDSSSGTRVPDGTGWVRFSTTPNAGTNYRLGGLPVLPVDPINTTGTGANDTAADKYLKFCGNANGEYKLVANLESSQNRKFEENDGGTLAGFYEVGTNLSISCSM